MTSPLLEQLIDAFRVLPGVGQKSAQRMAYHVLERERVGGRRLADALAAAVDRVGHCSRCRDFSEDEVCATCASASRDAQQLCVVESPVDRLAIEQATGYRVVMNCNEYGGQTVFQIHLHLLAGAPLGRFGTSA